MIEVSAIVPSYRPDETLLRVVQGLADVGFSRVILIDDGSGEDYRALFARAAQTPRCVLLRHEENRGKGAALKTGFQFFLDHPEQEVGVVTVDGDGQHDPQDALRCARALVREPDALVLGCRDFGEKEVPWRSSVGNRITAWCFRVLCGVRASDTQTGLRGIGAAFLPQLVALPGDRYEYETRMLLAAGRCGVSIREISIRTVYLEGNKRSHFRPIRDSAAIYGQIFRFLLSSLMGFGVDLLGFALLNALLERMGVSAEIRLLAATAAARAVSSLCNYAANRSLVFQSVHSHSRTLPRYYLLCVVQAAASYCGTYLLYRYLLLPEVWAKVVVDTLLFFASFQIQRRWIFCSRAKTPEKEGEQ